MGLNNIKLKELHEAVGGEIIAGNENVEFSGISIDSRNVQKGGLFIAIKGEKKNGHQFIEEAIKKGALAIILSERGDEIKSLKNSLGIIKVGDTLKALQNIAFHQRKKFNIPVIGITGSNGKSTVKEMAAFILSTKYKVLKNKGNLNNHIGLPLSLLELGSEHEVAVFEMGMSGLGEIRRLCEIALPGYGAVTNIGESHLESLGSVDKVVEAKKELIDFLGPECAAVLNIDGFGYDRLKSGIKGSFISFGIKNNADYRAKDIICGNTEVEFILMIREKDPIRCRVKGPGTHNVYNALCAAAIAGLMGVGRDGIVEGLRAYKPLPMRMEVMEWNDVTLINDAYNANPDSMAAAIKILTNRVAQGKKILVAGDMLELGERSKSAHYQIGKLVAEKNLDFFITYGDIAESCGISAIENGFDSSRVKNFKNPENAGSFLKDFLKKGDCLLIKGSRGTRMEKIIEKITQE